MRMSVHVWKKKKVPVFQKVSQKKKKEFRCTRNCPADCIKFQLPIRFLKQHQDHDQFREYFLSQDSFSLSLGKYLKFQVGCNFVNQHLVNLKFFLHAKNKLHQI